MSMYVQRYGYYPASQFIGPSTVEAAVWPARLQTFVDGNKDVFHCPSRDDRFRWSDTSPEPVVPASGLLLELGYEPNEPLVHVTAHFSYGYNVVGSGDSSYLSAQKGLGSWPKLASVDNGAAGELPASRVRLPADMIAVSDSDGDGRADYEIVPTRAANLLPGRIHSGGANVLFCDDHVQWYRQEDLIIPVPATLADAPRIRMWNHDHLAIPWDNWTPPPGKGP
jgi:prepilin-type processing-associated H-X9-DG protein